MVLRLFIKTKPLHIFISAGEASGDMHASAVLEALYKQHQHVKISAIAGPSMRAVGCETLCQMESLNVMGITDVIKALPRIKKIGKDICAWAKKEQPDVAILVDFPGFNMRLGEKLRNMGIPVLYYIAPKLWAWGHWRVKRLQRAQDRLACILPFEATWFAAKGVDAHYVGNPSALACQGGWSSADLKEKLAIESSQPLLALLPGSRRGELQNHVQLLADVLIELKNKVPNLVAVSARAPSVTDEQLQPLMDAGVHVLERLDEQYALRADAAIAVSGTATLELALWNTPTVLVYKTAPFTMWLGKKLLALNCVGLANIILDDQAVMPELLQEQVNQKNIVNAILPLINNDQEAQQQRQSFAQLRQRLGSESPSEAVANMACEMAVKNAD